MYITYIRKSIHLSKVKSNVNDKQYYVRNLSDKDKAANMLANLGTSLRTLIQSLNENDNQKGKGIKKLKKSFYH